LVSYKLKKFYAPKLWFLALTSAPSPPLHPSAFIDTDEFITFNRLNAEEHREHRRNKNEPLMSLRQTLPSIQDTTIWNYMHQFDDFVRPSPWGANVCIGMARVLFISVEEKNQSKLYDGIPNFFLLDEKSSYGEPTKIFDTLRFFYHGAPNENWEVREKEKRATIL